MVLSAAAACAGPVPPGAILTPVPTLAPATAAATIVQAITAAPSATPASSSSGSTNATAAPVATATPHSGGLTETELKYRLIDKFGELFYCDPDLYPVARGDQAAVAASTVPLIKQNEPEKYQAILKHLIIGASAVLDSGQTVAVYGEYKRLNAIVFTPAGDEFKFALRVQDTAGKGKSGFAIEGSISRQGDIAVTKKDPAFLQCPICLASDAQIDTPTGPVAVSELQVGMLVWTRDAAGNRVAGVVQQTAHVAVPATHLVVRLRLEDGRELRVSPGHPTADGRRVGELAAGDLLDGSRVSSVSREAYPDGATFDLLPSGGTGAYWADGILLGSTLR